MNRRLHIVGYIAILLFLAVLPMMISVKYFLHLSILALIWVIISQGQNLIQGYTGYVSITQAGFMGTWGLLFILVVLESWNFCMVDNNGYTFICRSFCDNCWLSQSSRQRPLFCHYDLGL